MQTVQERTKINRELQRLGLGHLKDPNLIGQMAYLVRDHAHFRGMLMHMPMPDRKEAYECLAPKLRFKAKSLEDYEIESRTLAEMKQLPHYDPKTLAVEEWKPQEFKTRRDDVICELCEAGHAVTGDGKWHHYGKPEQCVCAESRFVPEGWSVAPSRQRSRFDDRLDPACTCLSLIRPRSDNPCPVHDPYEYEAWKIESQRYAKVAERAIDTDLREGQATQQLSLVCRACTFEQKFRVKKRSVAYKLARQDGWLIEPKGTTALCRSCKPKPAIQ